MNTAENKNKSEMEMIKEGCLMASYGKTFFFTINSSLQIGKFKCSVVKIGTQGKDSLDIYLSVGEVKRLVDDILTGSAFKKLPLKNQTTLLHISIQRVQMVAISLILEKAPLEIILVCRLD